jgi:CxxC motif-containing protein (DUF1111 family)
MRGTNIKLLIAAIALSLLGMSETIQAQFRARDPGVRTGTPGAGDPIPGLTPDQVTFFSAGKEQFEENEKLIDGLGPRFNLDSCAGCHSQPATGGTSPAQNPEVAVGTAYGARNVIPSFVTPNGPVREARFVRKPDGAPDGGVHNLFVVSGRSDGTADASGCALTQPDFALQQALGNVIFRIPTPVYGAGLIEQIPDYEITANQAANALLKRVVGISGRPNRNGNDGRISRFGWKAQNQSLQLFAGEAYNVEMGITNELFQSERAYGPGCSFLTNPDDTTPTDTTAVGPDSLSNVEQFAFFMRFLAPPTPAPATTAGGNFSISRGRQLFAIVGCALCHTPTLRTGNSTVAALRGQNVNLFSDLLVHQMGPGLADGVSQGGAAPDEFRTAPLWGLGQRIFFLHDGRTSDLLDAIRLHRSAGNFTYGPSEANVVINNFGGLSETDKQHLLNFLRAL